MLPAGPLSSAKGVFAAAALGLNTVVMVLAMVPPALLKVALPAGTLRRACDRLLNALAERWVGNNDLWIGAVGAGTRWDVRGVQGLERRGWYLVASNHQGWVDILVLQRALGGRVPLLKFFLKRELIYVPVIGLAWWALDFPFLGRKGGVRGSRDDVASARAACERFRAVPTALLSFVEGTRFSPAKAARQKSPYRHLLKPKAAGMAVALTSLGDKLQGVLDVTIVYPGGMPTFWQFLCGRMDEVVVQLRDVPFPRRPGGMDDRRFRAEVEGWMEELWRAKDEAIGALKGG